MAEKILLEIATPTKLVFSGEVEFVTAPGSLGEFTVLPGHTPLLTAIRPGVLRCGVESFAVGWGYAEVRPNKMIVLVEFAERKEEVDAAALEKELSELKEKMAKASPEEREALSKQMERLKARLKLLSH